MFLPRKPGPFSTSPLLRRADQVLVAGLVVAALAATAAWWYLKGGHRGELIEIDRASPLEAHFVVDINKADWPELAELPEVGEILARRIVESRKTEGRFLDHAELQRVEGIGPLTLQKVSPYLLPLPGGTDVAASDLPDAAPLP